jgi:hypothetical protein
VNLLLCCLQSVGTNPEVNLLLCCLQSVGANPEVNLLLCCLVRCLVRLDTLTT